MADDRSSGRPAIPSTFQAPDGTTPTTTSFPIERMIARVSPSKHLLPDANYIIGGIHTPRRPTAGVAMSLT